MWYLNTSVCIFFKNQLTSFSIIYKKKKKTHTVHVKILLHVVFIIDVCFFSRTNFLEGDGDLCEAQLMVTRSACSQAYKDVKPERDVSGKRFPCTTATEITSSTFWNRRDSHGSLECTREKIKYKKIVRPPPKKNILKNKQNTKKHYVSLLLDTLYDVSWIINNHFLFTTDQLKWGQTDFNFDWPKLFFLKFP